MDRFERPHTIYSIDDPETGAPLYIGQAVNLRRRIRDHMKLRPGTASAVFLEPMIRAGLEPVFTTIAVVENRSAADIREAEEIKKALDAGHKLFNATHEIVHAKRKFD